MNNNALIIDGTSIFYRTLMTIENDLDSKESKETFYRRLCKDIYNLIYPYRDYIQQVYITKDTGKSFRKDLQVEYKATRKKDSSINWDNFNKITSEVLEKLSLFGFNVAMKERLEGDDLIYYITNECFEQKQNIIMFSADADLRQLCTINENNNFLIAVNPIYDRSNNKEVIRLYSTIETQKYIIEKNINLDVFDDSSYDNTIEKFLYSFLNDSSKKWYITNVIELLLNKILLGDKSDNIQRALPRGIGESFVGKFLFSVVSNKTKKFFLEDNWYKLILQRLEIHCKKKYIESEIINILKENVNLILLDDATIPIKYATKNIKPFNQNGNAYKVIESLEMSNNENQYSSALKNLPL